MGDLAWTMMDRERCAVLISTKIDVRKRTLEQASHYAEIFVKEATSFTHGNHQSNLDISEMNGCNPSFCTAPAARQSTDVP